MWHNRRWSYNWKNDSVFFGGYYKEFWYFYKWMFGYVTILQWWYNRQCSLKDGNNVCWWLIEIILWCDRRERNLGRKKIDCVNISNLIGWWYITFDTTIVFQLWSNVPSIFSMGCPIFRVVYFEWTNTLVTGSASGVALKSKLPWKYAWGDSLWFILEFRKIFRVITACGMRQSH